MSGAGVAAAPAAAPEAAEEEEEAPQAVQTSFTIKMEKYDASKKVQKFTIRLFLCGIHPNPCKENAGQGSFGVLKPSFSILKTSFTIFENKLLKKL